MTEKILLIDDEEKLRSLLARLLKLEGYIITEAGSLKAAHKAIEAEDPDVILCDVKLPDGNGVDFISEVKKKRGRRFHTAHRIFGDKMGRFSDHGWPRSTSLHFFIARHPGNGQ